jgi:hypothetical protein
MPNRDETGQRRDRLMFDAEYFADIEVEKTRRLMRYTFEDFQRDWETAIALSILMAMGDARQWGNMLDDTMSRVAAYQQNNDHRVWAWLHGRVEL